MVKAACLQIQRSRVRTPLWPSSVTERKCFFAAHSWRFNIVGSQRNREEACSASDRQGSNFESCVCRAVSSHLSHHPQEVLLAQFSLYMHTFGLKPHLFYLFITLKHAHAPAPFIYVTYSMWELRKRNQYIYWVLEIVQTSTPPPPPSPGSAHCICSSDNHCRDAKSRPVSQTEAWKRCVR